MNYNLISYLIYLFIIVAIILKVGHMCYKNGRVYFLHFKTGENVNLLINKTLLVCYYLINIGYAVLAIAVWDPIETWKELVESLTQQLSIIILILAGLHYFNLCWIHLFLNKMNNQNQ